MRLVRICALACFGVLVAGCYTLQPARGVTPELGSRVALDINDAGRVALGGPMGPEIAQVQGRLVRRDGEGYLIAVTSIHMIRGGVQLWSGEEVRIRPEHVHSVYERQFNWQRSAVAGAATVGSIVAFLVTRNLLGGGTEDGNPPIDTTRTTRIPRR